MEPVEPRIAIFFKGKLSFPLNKKKVSGFSVQVSVLLFFFPDT
jgi:hypothetical protein